VVYDGTNETVYLDGTFMGAAAHTQTAYPDGNYQYQLGTGRTVGAWPSIPDGTWVNFSGLIDEPTVYSRALTISEVQSIFTAGSNGKSLVTISPLLLAGGSVGVTYNQSCSAANGIAPYSFAVSSGVLPLGFTLSPGGVLSGSPVADGSYTFTVTAEDANRCVASRAYTLQITGGQCLPQPAGLTGWWRAEGDANDFTGANHGAPQGAVSYAPGRRGEAFQLDGSSYVQVPDAAALDGYPLTLALWLRTSSTGPELRGLLSKYVDSSLNGFSLHLANGHLGAWYHRDANDSVNPGALGLDGGAVADGAWHHVVFTVGPAGGALYVDGALINSVSWFGTPGPPTTTAPLLIGRFDTYMPTFDGLIDEPMLYSTALSASDVLSLFGSGSHGLCGHCTAIPANLIGWWRAEGDTTNQCHLRARPRGTGVSVRRH